MLFAGALDGALIGAVAGAAVGLIVGIIQYLKRSSEGADEGRSRRKRQGRASGAAGAGNALFWVGLIGLIIGAFGLIVCLLLPPLTNGRASWSEAMLGIIPSAVITIVGFVLLLIGVLSKGAADEHTEWEEDEDRPRRRRHDDDDEDERPRARRRRYDD